MEQTGKTRRTRFRKLEVVPRLVVESRLAVELGKLCEVTTITAPALKQE